MDDYDLSLLTLASQLDGLVGSYFRMRYPDNCAGPYIPHNLYSEEDALEAYRIAEQIIANCRTIVINK